MTVQLLISTMNQTDFSLLQKMNIFSDTIVINQCDHTDYHVFIHNGFQVEWFDCNERGIGKSRNMALMKATADICVFSDDDMVYEKNAHNNLVRVFEENPKAELIIFNVEGLKNNCKKFERLHMWNVFKYGAARIAVRRKSIVWKRVSFSLEFGGGAIYGCGEDTLFLHDCLRNQIKIYRSPCLIGKNLNGKSTWFSGYNKKFFEDKGVLFFAMSPTLSRLYCIRFVIKKAHLFKNDTSKKQALQWMLQGVKQAAIK